ncbi:MAG: trehalose-phosphatase, partial [Candidatus Brocadiales bacterium]
MKHALKVWPSLREFLKEYKHILLFLDYDGTLTPIAKRPDLAVLSRGTRGLIESLRDSERFIVCLVSGRSITDLKARVGVEGIIYVGNHGLEMEGLGMRFVNATARKSRPILKRIYKELNTGLKSIAGAFVEDKGLSLTLHYRLVKKIDVPIAKDIFDTIVRPYLSRKEIKVNGGKKVLEVRPPVAWDKGKATLWVLKRYKVHLETNSILPVCFGDDCTDESAFKAVGDNGVTIFVGSANSNTAARLFLKSPKEVGKFLERLVRTFGLGPRKP